MKTDVTLTHVTMGGYAFQEIMIMFVTVQLSGWEITAKVRWDGNKK